MLTMQTDLLSLKSAPAYAAIQPLAGFCDTTRKYSGKNPRLTFETDASEQMTVRARRLREIAIAKVEASAES